MLHELIEKWYSTHQRTAALDSIIDEVREHFADADKQLEAYSVSVEQSLKLLADASLSNEEKVTIVKELLSVCHSGELVSASDTDQAPPAFAAQMGSGISFGEDVVVSFD